MSDEPSDKPKEAVERAKAEVDRRDEELERVGDKLDALVQEEGPKARERLAEAARRGRLKPQ